MKKQAFTFIEIVITVGILLMVFMFSSLYLESSVLRTDLRTQASQLVDVLREAQSDANAGKGTAGVHLASDSYTYFIGATYSADPSSYFTSVFPDVMSIQNIALNGAGTDVIFTDPSGETSQYGSFELSSSRLEESVLITITQLGRIYYE